ncbi:unnamed protein product [Ceratitis capitata]|uniref:(Mediterranean fruit fly) hypothetical protein n=1 Tax=Ceratitis capitata TaxID=7213 RepID=A0A811UFE2_CERCA|nr:unnamed protein product [Ceratitis capitata]
MIKSKQNDRESTQAKKNLRSGKPTEEATSMANQDINVVQKNKGGIYDSYCTLSSWICFTLLDPIDIISRGNMPKDDTEKK